MSAFQYTPLENANSQIRLLKVKYDARVAFGGPAEQSRPLHATLSTHYFAKGTLSRTKRLKLSVSMPLFYALSYVWGDTTNSKEILLDGKPFKVGRNLYDALRALQINAIGDFNIWIDAICINQDDLAERSAQILLMRDIYHAAATVKIWLGQISDDATRCFKFIKQTSATFSVDGGKKEHRGEEDLKVLDTGWGGKLIGGLATLSNGSFRMMQGVKEIEDIIHTPLLDDKAELLMDPDENESLHQESIEDISDWRPSKRTLEKFAYEGDFHEIARLLEKVFLENEWFERMWVVQEFGVADSVDLQIGHVTVDWPYVARIIYWLHYVHKIEFRHIRRITGLEKIRLGWNKRRRQPLRDIIRECRFRRATDPRDKIFSVLGLVGDHTNKFLHPDYSKPVGEVYANTARHFLTQSNSLDPICGWQISGRTEGESWLHPSWAPDYSLDQEDAPSPLVAIDGRESIYAASGYDHRSKFMLQEYPSSDWRTLTITGIRINQITALSDYDDGSAHENVLKWSSFLASALHIPDGGMQACRTSLEAIFLAIYGESMSDTTIEPKSREEDGRQTSNLSPDELTKTLITTLVSDRLTTRERMASADIKIMLNHTSTHSEDFTAKAKAAFEAGTKKRRLAVTNDYHIGAVPQQAQIGDLIFVLYGCSVPVVMRLRDDQKSYQFVGECYMSGFMDGEAIAVTVKGMLKEEELRLR